MSGCGIYSLTHAMRPILLRLFCGLHILSQNQDSGDFVVHTELCNHHGLSLPDLPSPTEIPSLTKDPPFSHPGRHHHCT